MGKFTSGWKSNFLWPVQAKANERICSNLLNCALQVWLCTHCVAHVCAVQNVFESWASGMDGGGADWFTSPGGVLLRAPHMGQGTDCCAGSGMLLPRGPSSGSSLGAGGMGGAGGVGGAAGAGGVAGGSYGQEGSGGLAAGTEGLQGQGRARHSLELPKGSNFVLGADSLSEHFMRWIQPNKDPLKRKSQVRQNKKVAGSC